MSKMEDIKTHINFDGKKKAKNNSQREKNRRYKRIQREKKRKEFLKLKKPSIFSINIPESVQDVMEIKRVAPNGIWEVGDNLYSKTYLMYDLNYCTMTYQEQVSFFGEWCRILNAIDAYLFKFTIFNKNRDMMEFRNKILYQHKADEYNLQRDCYNNIITSKMVDGKKGIEQVKYFTITIQRSNYEDAAQGLASIEANLIKEFASLGAVLVPLNSNERFRIIHDFIRMGNEEKYEFDIKNCVKNGSDWRNDICSDLIDFDETMFFTENRCCKAMYVQPKSYPEDDMPDEFFDSLINITIPSIVTVDYIPINKTAAKEAFERQYMSTQDKIRKQQDKRNQRGNFTSEISYTVQKENENIKKMLDDINENGQKMFFVGVNVVLTANSLEELDDAEDSVNLITENYGCYLDEYKLRQREALMTALPIGNRYVDELRSMFTRMAGILIPFKAMEMQMKDNPFYYGVNKETRNIIACNRKKLVNGNGFVFGVTGAGKSMTGSKLEIGSVFLNTNDDIIIIDPTFEYEDVAEAFNGSFINIGPDSKNYINPLHIDIKNLSPKNIRQIITQKSTIMCGICEHAMEKDFETGYRSIIDRCIKILYERILTTPVNERTVPIMSDFYTILKDQTDKEVHDIVLALVVFITGSMNIFNHQNNVDIDNRVQVYGLRDIGEDLESVGMLITLSYIRQKIIKNSAEGRCTWLYIDEFHTLMDKKYSRKYFISLYKKVRKLGGLCTGITQNVSDTVFDKDTAKLLSNSEYTMFLRMGPGDADVIIDAFDGKLTEAHLKYIDNAAPGTGLIRFGNIVIPMDNRIDKDNIIYDIFNTNFQEKAALRMAQREKEGNVG